MAPSLHSTLSSSDEDLFEMPKNSTSKFSPNFEKHTESTYTMRQPEQIPLRNGKRSQGHSSPSSTSFSNNNNLSKCVKITRQLDSSEDEPISIMPKKKERKPVRKKRTRKKVEGEDEDPTPPSKKKAKTSSKKTSSKKTSKKKSAKPRKTYEMPGQKKDTPHELDGGRIFYESLRKQIPASKIAEEYLLRHGLLPRKEAQKIVDKMEKTKQEKKSYTRKSISPRKTTSRKSRSVRKRKNSKASKNGKLSKKGKETKARNRVKRKKKFEKLLESSEDEPLVFKKR